MLASELCPYASIAIAGPRPGPYVPGLIVTKAIQGSSYSEDVGYLQPVEVYMYKGSNRIVATGEVSKRFRLTSVIPPLFRP